MNARQRTTGLALVIASAIGCAAIVAAETENKAEASHDRARYVVEFIPSWNPATHPEDYPLSHAKHGLLTPIIGATHGEGFTLFAKGMKPSEGLERLSEMGKHDPLDAEIQKAITAGTAGSIITFADGSPGPVHPSVTQTIDVDSDFPMVSLAGMIAPSPDWFYGVSNVRVYENGRFVPQIVVVAYAYDSGGDAGTSYMAEDMDLMPKQATKLLDNSAFVRNGKRVPVGVFVFKLVPSMDS